MSRRRHSPACQTLRIVQTEVAPLLTESAQRHALNFAAAHLLALGFAGVGQENAARVIYRE